MTTIDRKTLASALDLAAYVAPRRHSVPILTHARLASNCEAVTISATDLVILPGYAVEPALTSIELNATFLAPAPLNIGFNARYILDALNAITSDQVIWQLSDSGTPAIIKGADDSHLWQILVPMRMI